MDPSQAAFEALEQAVGLARFTFDRCDPPSAVSPQSTYSQVTIVPTASADRSDSGSDHANESDSPHYTQDVGRYLSQPTEARSIDLPPTPPTPERNQPARLDRSLPHARQFPRALYARSSGLGSSSVDWHSLPTPDPSPPVTRDYRLLPFAWSDFSPSSYAGSFQTARENLSRSETPILSHCHSPSGSPLSLSTMSAQANTANVGLRRQDDASVDRQSQGTDGIKLPISRFQAAGFSDEVEPRRHSIADEPKLADSPPSASVTRSLSQSTAQRRLWSVIQPGDAVKRPDQALLYANPSTPFKRKKPVTLQAEENVETGESQQTNLQPLDEEANREENVSMEHVEEDPVIHSQPEPEAEISGMDIQAECDAEQKDLETSPKEDSKPLSLPAEIHKPNKSTIIDDELQDTANEQARTPHSATKSSLEDNNVVYKLIREENVKRHSNASDGSVQAMVVALPEQKHKLRHTPKRHSLRGDSSLTSNSYRSSAESGRKSTKRHTETTFTTSDTELTSPEMSPSAAKAGLRTASASRPPSEAPVDIPSPAQGRRSPHGTSSGANTVVPARRSSASQLVPGNVPARPSSEHAVVNEDEPIEEDDDELQEIPRLGSPPMHQAAHMSSMPVYVSLAELYSPPKLRRFSNESRLENVRGIRRTALDRSVRRGSQPLEVKLEQAAKELTREGQELPDDRHSIALTSAMTSPKRGSFDFHSHHPRNPSFSVSQASMPTSIEVLEARGISIFPHHNESLLVVQHGVRSSGHDENVERPNTSGVDYTTADELTIVTRPRANSIDAIGRPKHAVDSPLTNPRAAPEPPVIRFIPPTPVEEIDVELKPVPDQRAPVAGPPPRRPSISQRVRRYSEGLMQPLRMGSLRRPQRPPPRHRVRAATSSSAVRPTHLSSFWHPRGFWDGYDSDSDSGVDDDDDLFEDVDDHDANLPPGGDTSHHPAVKSTSSSSFFPRNMSVRMPGFRGTGGFLLGNSLGIDRHGTNNRRHHVPSIRLRAGLGGTKRTNRKISAGQAPAQEATAPAQIHTPVRSRSPQQQHDEQDQSSPPRSFALPFRPGLRVEYVGLRYFRSHYRQARALEKRRERLRGSIGPRVFHEGRYGTS